MTVSREVLNPAFRERELPIEDRQYLAGAFDAGIGIWINNHISRSLYVRVTRKEKQGLNVFSPFFLEPRQSKHTWYFGTAGEQARPILEVVRSDVRLKKPIVELALEYLDWKQNAHVEPKAERVRHEQKFAQRMKDLYKPQQVYNYDIGQAPLDLAYIAGYLDQHRGSINTVSSGGYLSIDIKPQNKSFLQHLQQQFGGATFPKDAENPTQWRIMGADAEKVWSYMKVYMKILPQQMEDVVWKHSSRGERK